MKIIETTKAVGMPLCHDITRIVKDEFAGVAFKKGHIIQECDVAELLKLGKDHVYVWENVEGHVHENDAAARIANIVCGDNLSTTLPREGKINFVAQADGLLKVDAAALYNINMIDEIIVATLHSDRPVKSGTIVGATRVIPLMISDDKFVQAEKITKEPVVKILPIVARKAALITTGNEIFHGRIKDAFSPIVAKKVLEYGCTIERHDTLPDDKDKIRDAIKSAIDAGCKLVLCTGGMSVDPDDLTPAAIKSVGGNVVTYGTPVLPGSMLLLAYVGDAIVLGLPGCVMHSAITMFDIVLPRVLAGEVLTKADIAAYGHGGLCEKCEVCTYPACAFGKN